VLCLTTPTNHIVDIEDSRGKLIPVIINYKNLGKRSDSYDGGIGFVTDLTEVNSLQTKIKKLVIENETLKERLIDEMPDAALEERKHLEQEVKESHEYLENIVESCGDGICIVDSDGKIDQVNRSFVDMGAYESSY
jgi:transcriptional regulator with PAS, ATPase and Fis domain